MTPLAQYFVPQWISILFLVFIPLPFVLILMFVRREAKKLNLRWAFPVVTAFFAGYLAYITFGSFGGWYNEVFFPPKVLLFTTFPYAFLLFGLVLNTRAYQAIVQNAKLESLIGLHIFRLVGVFFILLAVHEALPKPFAFIASIGDMLTAISSIWVVRALRDRKSYAKKLAGWWNLFGTVDILFTAIGANVLTKISIDTGTMGVDTLATFPFCIIPAFAPPTILFIHWAIYRRLRNFPG